MTIFEEEKALGEMLNTALQTLIEWEARAPRTPDGCLDELHLYAMHTLGYAECLAEIFMQAGLAERLSMREDIERIEYEIRVLAGTNEK
ncbi:MAG: hypothetical protein IKH27_10515 [Oscillospiraceae bacterium]|nr:hypothetical protein [Oscillospiraceae bacterium]MBR3448226.1 hypothetical protein [Oscillospiraceae bacterium]